MKKTLTFILSLFLMMVFETSLVFGATGKSFKKLKYSKKIEKRLNLYDDRIQSLEDTLGYFADSYQVETVTEADFVPKVYANGVEIGTAVEEKEFVDFGIYQLKLKFHKDFETVVLQPDGTIGKDSPGSLKFYYTELNCEGKPYYYLTSPEQSRTFLFSLNKGKIFVQNGNKYYVPPTQTAYLKTVYSQGRPGACRNHQGPPYSQSPFSAILLEILPNDPTVTNLPNENFKLPITVEGKFPLTIK